MHTPRRVTDRNCFALGAPQTVSIPASHVVIASLRELLLSAERRGPRNERMSVLAIPDGGLTIARVWALGFVAGGLSVATAVGALLAMSTKIYSRAYKTGYADAVRRSPPERTNENAARTAAASPAA